MEGIVAKRTLKKSYYNKNINNLNFREVLYNKEKSQKKSEKSRWQRYKEKVLFKICLQSITVIALLIFVLAIKVLKIDIVLKADITKKIANYYQESYSANEIINSAKSLLKYSYLAVKPVMPNKIEEKAHELYKLLITNKKVPTVKENNKNKIQEKNSSEVKIYEESGADNKENAVKESVGVSADITESKEKIVAVSSSINSQSSTIDKIKATKIKFVKPVSGVITSHYGAREVIFEGIDSYHTGTDIAANTGTKVVSSIAGKVTRASYNKYNGNFVEVTSGDIKTIYCHMSKLSVKVGASVKAGSKIGEVGSTGLSTGPHLHFEIVYKGTKVDPEMILDL